MKAAFSIQTQHKPAADDGQMEVTFAEPVLPAPSSEMHVPNTPSPKLRGGPRQEVVPGFKNLQYSFNL